MICRRGMLAALVAAAPLAGVRPVLAAKWHNIDVTGYVPALSFNMVDATTGKPVTAADFRGKLVLLYFGYTQCPDICRLTLQNVAESLQHLGKDAADVRLLFVTVDPDRDSLTLLRDYTTAFSPYFVGLRGNPDQIAQLARRYRIAYSVTPSAKTQAYGVTHSSAIYAFGRDGDPRLLIGSLATANPDITGTADDLERVLREPKPGLLGRLTAIL